MTVKICRTSMSDITLNFDDNNTGFIISSQLDDEYDTFTLVDNTTTDKTFDDNWKTMKKVKLDTIDHIEIVISNITYNLSNLSSIEYSFSKYKKEDSLLNGKNIIFTYKA